MLKWIRNTRFDLKTTIILLVLAGAFWALFTWARYKDFVPEEFRHAADSAQTSR